MAAYEEKMRSPALRAASELASHRLHSVSSMSISKDSGVKVTFNSERSTLKDMHGNGGNEVQIQEPQATLRRR